MSHESAILALIKDHINYTRLCSGLHETGLETESIVINLGDTIFRLSGIADGKGLDKRFGKYLDVIGRISKYSREEWQAEVEPLANEAFALILNWKNKQPA